MLTRFSIFYSLPKYCKDIGIAQHTHTNTFSFYTYTVYVCTICYTIHIVNIHSNTDDSYFEQRTLNEAYRIYSKSKKVLENKTSKKSKINPNHKKKKELKPIFSIIQNVIKTIYYSGTYDISYFD